MRVAELVRRYSPQLGGGIDSFVHAEAAALTRLGHEVTILAWDTAGSAGGGEPRVVRLRGAPEGAPSALLRLRMLAPDVIRVHGYSTWSPTVAGVAKHLLAIPVVFTPSYHPQGNHPPLLRRLFDLGPGRWSLRQADRICYLSLAERTHLKRLGAHDEQLVRTREPLEDEFFSGSDPLPFLRAFPKLSHPLLLFCGRLDWNKGLVELLEAFAMVLKTHPTATLALLGPDAGAASAVLQRSHEMGLDDRVFWPGPQEQKLLLSAYAAAALLVLPSAYESFGRVLIEAMAAGLPVVATRVGGIPEIVEHGRTGLLVSFGDIPALAEALLGLLDDEPLRRRLSLEGRRHAATFRSERYGVELETILNQVVN